MKSSTIALLSFIIVCSMTAISGKVWAEPYLFELLDKPDYCKSWQALFAGEKNLDAWLTRYARTRNGPATPARSVQLGETIYQSSTVCKTHDCGNNQFFVLFAPSGTKAWGLLLTDGKNERFFGNPDDEKIQALRSAAHQ